MGPEHQRGPGDSIRPGNVDVMAPQCRRGFWLVAVSIAACVPASLAEADDVLWSLRPIKEPRQPVLTPTQRQRARTPIDGFVISRLARSGLELSPAADRATYLRRVTINLTGLLPTPDAVREFIADRRPDAYERVVDRLLASSHYGEKWGRHWLDVVRYAESNGFERNKLRTNFWRYRDYVIASLNHDKPYDQFVREQLAGDAIDPGNPEYLVATGFLVAGPKNDVQTDSKLQRMKRRQDEIDEYVRVTSTTLLGLTVGCGRCHDHMFDPVPSRDYYGLAAVFSGLDRRDKVVATRSRENGMLLGLSRYKPGSMPRRPPSQTHSNQSASDLSRSVSQHWRKKKPGPGWSINGTRTRSPPCSPLTCDLSSRAQRATQNPASMNSKSTAPTRNATWRCLVPVPQHRQHRSSPESVSPDPSPQRWCVRQRQQLGQQRTGDRPGRDRSGWP
ncbi:MAG: hypothetical protein CM1200mP2_19130 [Planctomycetaceae bacterium]|nr:MAG: hypothetical protein CM1200mP2_19130 [Planctomycetaceae bacterium]